MCCERNVIKMDAYLGLNRHKKLHGHELFHEQTQVLEIRTFIYCPNGLVGCGQAGSLEKSLGLVRDL